MDRPGLRDEVARRAGLRGGSSRGSDGTTHFSLFLSGRNGFSALGALNDLGTINLLVNLSVVEKGEVEVDPESRTKGYPSIEGFAYRLIQGELVVQVLFKKEEQDPSELNQPMASRSWSRSTMERPFIPVLMFALLFAGCGRAPEQEWTDLAGDLEDCLVVVFRLNSDPRAVYSFLEQHTTVPDPRGGRAFRAGIGSIVQVGVGEHDAYKVCFWPAATREQRAAVWRGMSSRPLVEGLYEDVDNARIGVGAARSE